MAPGLRSVELSAADYGAQRFSQHWHTGFAVGVATRHAQGFHANGREWTVGAGDLIVLNPGQMHNGYALHPEGWSSRMAYIPENAFAVLAGAHLPGFALRFTDPVVASPALAQDFLAWHCLSESAADVHGHALTQQLFAGLAALMQPVAMDAVPESAAPASGLRERLRAQAGQGDASVASLHAGLHLSRSGSWRRVKTELGVAPKPLLKQLRLMSAKQLLAQGCPVIEAALDCGFHDQSHFSNQFAAAYGFTPAQFRRAQMS
ncbi:AraC family transcriptional regulator [Ramlibacter sp.]|uniref:helix-turn-helix domain-containing protein n=1 Tax=Ramlibacter sp. TaxID=1917967 RepID=UPI00185373FB|nr:AraC family transcriptional regulator [Ramlibacter sp.]MBA2673948.1 AraC family transcriptional regulator [Ramlibacter sp.]